MHGDSRWMKNQQHLMMQAGRCGLFVVLAVAATLSSHLVDGTCPDIKIDTLQSTAKGQSNVTCSASGHHKVTMMWSYSFPLLGSHIYQDLNSTSLQEAANFSVLSVISFNESFQHMLKSGYCRLDEEETVVQCSVEINCLAWFDDNRNGTTLSKQSIISSRWPLPEPKRPLTSDCTSFSCKIHWDPFDEVEIPRNQFLYVTDFKRGDKALGRRRLPSAATSFDYRDLDPYTNYEMLMYLVLAADEDFWKSTPIGIRFRTKPVEPRMTPKFLPSLLAGDDYIQLAWQNDSLPQSSGTLTTLKLDVVLLKYGGKVIKDVGVLPFRASAVLPSSKGTTHIVRGLSAWRSYQFTLKACNDDGQCDFQGQETVFETTEGEPSAAPSNISIIGTGSNYFKISYASPDFTSSNGIILGYRHKILSGSRTGSMSQRPRRSIGNSLNEHIFQNLQPFSNYDVVVAAYTKAGTGPFSAPLTVKTTEGPPSPPQFARLIRYPLDGSCIIQWGPPLTKNGVVRGYIVKSYYEDVLQDTFDVPVNDYNLYTKANCNASSRMSFVIIATTIMEGEPTQMLYARKIISGLPDYHSTAVPSDEVSYDMLVYIAIAILFVMLLVLLLVSFCIYKRRYTNKLVRREILMHAIPSPLRLQHDHVPISDVVHSQADLYSALETDALTSNQESTEDLRMVDHSRKGIRVEEFPAYVKLKLEDDHPFKNEYKRELKSGKCYSWDIADRPENKPKNRYTNIAAYDHSRVILRSDSGKRKQESDYFNANHIEGYRQDSTTKYIACHGPTESVIADFWRMVWQENVTTILMLTNLEERGKSKCYQYWPSFGTMRSGQVTITAMGHDITTDYKIRTFELAKTGARENRIIKQFHFLTWPDHGVPDHPTALISLRRRVRSFYDGKGPMVVHCSAGVGRTGCFILVDAAMECIADTGTVDLFNYLQYLRTRRIDMVQTLTQYKFAHNVILEYVTCGCTEITASEFQKKFHLLKRGNGMQDEYQILEKTSESGKEQGNFNRVFLQEGQRIAYVDAFFVDGYKQNDAFIVSAAPDQNDIARFWKYVVEQRCHTIVTLHKLKENGKINCQFWPSASEQISIGDQSIVLMSENREADLVVRKFKVLNSQDNDCFIQQFHFMEWPEFGVPTSRTNLLKLMSLVEKSQQNLGNGPILVQCSNGFGRSGTFIAVYNSTERLKTEQLIDVLQCVRAIRTNRSGAVENFEQYDFIYNMIGTYLEAFQTYSNFEHAISLVQ